MKGLEELGKLVNGKVSLADQGSQSTCLKLSLPTGNAEVTQLRHQTATFGDTSTSSVSIVRGSPSALRSLRQ